MNQAKPIESSGGDEPRLAAQKRPYRPPVLTDLGLVRHATLGATNGNQESGGGGIFQFDRGATQQ